MANRNTANQTTRFNKRNLTFEFYDTVYSPDQNGVVALKLGELQQRLRTATERNWVRDGHDDVYRIESFQISGRDCQGVFLRLRTTATPIVASLDIEGFNPLNLQPGEHLTETIYFKYFDETRTLVISKNRNLGSALRLGEYVRNKSDFSSLWFNIRKNQDSIRRVMRMNIISRMELSVVSGMPTLQSSEGNSVEAVTGLSQIYGGLEIEIIVKQGRGGGAAPLNSGNVKETMEHVTTALGVAVNKARVKGKRNPDDKDTWIDLLDDVMQEEEEVTYTGSAPLPSKHFEAIQAAYDRRRDELRAATADRMNRNAE